MPKLNQFSAVIALAGLLIASAPDCRATLMSIADVGFVGSYGSPHCGANSSTTTLGSPFNGPPLNVISSQVRNAAGAPTGTELVSSASFNCTPPDASYWIYGPPLSGAATTSAKVGAGPLSISLFASAGAGGIAVGPSYLWGATGVADSLAVWNNLVVPLGGTGAGFLQIDYAAFFSCCGGSTASVALGQNGNPVGYTTCSGTGFDVSCEFPITFGQTYSLEFFASAWSPGDEAPSSAQLTVDSVSLYNANGNLLPNGSLAVAPEPTTIMLLVTVIVGVAWLVSNRQIAQRNQPR